jgi:4-coumarate--CoA ligase
MFHIYGFAAIIMRGLRGGNTIVSLPRFEPKTFLGVIEKYKVSVARK